MSIEFRSVVFGPLKGITVVAPASAIIGVIGEKGSGVTELLKLAGGAAQPESGEVIAGVERRFVALGDTLNLAPASVVALDQALATQDAVVRARTLTGLDRLRRSGATILLASQEDSLLALMCDEIWWLDGGQIAAKGDPKETLAKYRRHVSERVRSWGETIGLRLAPLYRPGDGRAALLSVETLGAEGKSTVVWKSGEMATVRATVRYHEALENPVLGLMIRTQVGFEVYGTDTALEHTQLGPRQAGETVTVSFSFLCDLCPRAYTLTLGSHDPDGTVHDWLEDALAVTVTDERSTPGVANLRARISVEKPG